MEPEGMPKCMRKDNGQAVCIVRVTRAADGCLDGLLK